MSSIDIMKRIQKYDGINLFLVLDKNGKKLNPEMEEDFQMLLMPIMQKFQSQLIKQFLVLETLNPWYDISI